MAEYDNLLNEDREISKPIDISWENISCIAKTPDGDKQILKSVSGKAYHGEFFVIMGSSGAGKTTLLNILSDRLRSSSKYEIEGKVEANGQPISDFNYQAYVGYVIQEDCFIECLTVYESLMFVAKLKSDDSDKERLVDNLIQDLGLVNVRNSYVGGLFYRGISGGEKKRLSIGVELITNPKVLFLDEPTSGLDSFTALKIVDLLIAHARSGCAVITTIHQPSSTLFYKFDKLVLMCDGKIVFHGSARASVEHFKDIGFECPELINPADHYMDVLNIKNTAAPTEEERTIIDTLNRQYEKMPKPNQKLESTSLSEYTGEYSSSFYNQTYHLTYRAYLIILRNPTLLLSRIILILVTAIAAMIIYWDLGEKGYTEVKNRTSFCFFTAASLSMYNVLTCCLAFPRMRQTIIREYNSRIYGIVPYFISLNINDFFFDIFSTLLYCLMVYWTVDLNTKESGTVVEFFFISYLTYYYGGGVGLLSGSAAGTPEEAMGICSSIVFPFIYFAGFYRAKDMPDVTSWLKYISPLYYLFSSYLNNQFDDLDITGCCDNPDSFQCEACDPIEFYDLELENYENFIFCILISVMFRGLALMTMKKSVSEKA